MDSLPDIILMAYSTKCLRHGSILARDWAGLAQKADSLLSIMVPLKIPLLG